MPLLTVNGVEVNVEDSGRPPGRPDAPTLVLGHGLLFSTTMWRHQVEALRSDYRCVAVDWRGQGRSPAAPAYDMDSLYDDLVGVIEHLDVGPVHYAGLSMGGFVGLRLAARRPDLVRSLVLIDSSAGPEDPEKISRYRMLARIYGVVGLRLLRSRVAPIMFSRTFLDRPQGKAVVDTWVAELARQPRGPVKRAILGVTDRVPVLDEIDSITAPTLVLTGSADVATPVARADTIAGVIPGARLEVLTGVGHVSALEAPDAVTRELAAFLETV
ncbi:MAG TPA: alpha/beta fold hydrolase [Marmoricola sp.]